MPRSSSSQSSSSPQPSKSSIILPSVVVAPAESMIQGRWKPFMDCGTKRRGMNRVRGAMRERRGGLVLLLACLACVSLWVGNSSTRGPVQTDLVQGGSSDERLLFAGAPKEIQAVVGGMARHQEPAAVRRQQEAVARYDAELQAFEQKEAASGAGGLPDGVVPSGDADPDAPGAAGPATSPSAAAAALASAGNAQSGKEEIQGTEDEIEAIEAQNGLTDKDVAAADTASAAAHARAAATSEGSSSSSSEVKNLEDKVKVLEGLNARLALGPSAAPSPVTPAAAVTRARKVAEAGVVEAEAHADDDVASDYVAHSPTAGASPAEQHALRVAALAGAKAASKVEHDTKAMQHHKWPYKMNKLPGVVSSAWAGVHKAMTTGKPDASSIPGVKEDTWPFAPGSFRAKDKVIPGVNQNSWWVFEPGSSWAKDRKHHLARPSSSKHGGPGGCVPDAASGKLRCDGGVVLSPDELDKAFGLRDVQAKAAKAKGELRTALPGLKNDAETQRLNAAAAAFAAMKAPTQMLAQMPRMQQLDAVGGECSTLLDCLRTNYAAMVPHHTHPYFGSELDVNSNVNHPAKTESKRWNPWGSLDVVNRVGGDSHIGFISRPSFRSSSGQRHDVPAAQLPSSAGMTMYAHARRRASRMAQQMLSDRYAYTEMLDGEATNSTDGSSTNSSQGYGIDMTVCTLGVKCNTWLPVPETRFNDSGKLCDKLGVNCDTGFEPLTTHPGDYQDVKKKVTGKDGADMFGENGVYPTWTPFMYGDSKPTSWLPGVGEGTAQWQPDYEYMKSQGNGAELGVHLRQAQLLRQADDYMREAEMSLPRGSGGDGAPLSVDSRPVLLEEQGSEADGAETQTQMMAGVPAAASASAADASSKNLEDVGVNVDGGYHASLKKLEDAGVNVDSGWSPYREEDIWGKYNPGLRHPAARASEGQAFDRQFETRVGGENKLGDIDRADGARGMANLENAWMSITGQVPAAQQVQTSLIPRQTWKVDQSSDSEEVGREEREAEAEAEAEARAEEEEREREEMEARRKAYWLNAAPEKARQRILEEEQRRSSVV